MNLTIVQSKIYACGVLVRIRRPCISLISFLRASLMIRCCFTIFSPLNSGATTFMSNIAPQPPDTSVTSISWACGNLFLRMDIIFCSACLPASALLDPFHSRDSNDTLRELDVNTRWNIIGRVVAVSCRSFNLARDKITLLRSLLIEKSLKCLNFNGHEYRQQIPSVSADLGLTLTRARANDR